MTNATTNKIEKINNTIETTNETTFHCGQLLGNVADTNTGITLAELYSLDTELRHTDLEDNDRLEMIELIWNLSLRTGYEEITSFCMQIVSRLENRG